MTNFKSIGTLTKSIFFKKSIQFYNKSNISEVYLFKVLDVDAKVHLINLLIEL